jgi:hypothetical protein
MVSLLIFCYLLLCIINSAYHTVGAKLCLLRYKPEQKNSVSLRLQTK